MKKSWKNMLLTSTVVMGLGLVMVGCGSSTATSTNTGSGSDSAKKEYVVGTDATYAPFESMVGDKIQGFDMDVLDAVAQAEGIKFKYVNTPWDGIFLSLKNGERDVVASAVTITDERKQTLDFSDPYFDANQMIVTKKGSNIKTLADLKGKKVAVQNATTGADVANDLFGKDSPNIKRFESMPLAFMELKNGGVDAAIGDNGVVLQYMQANGSDFQMSVDPSFKKEQYGFAVSKGKNADLLAKINDGIKKIKENGKLEEINKKYGFTK